MKHKEAFIGFLIGIFLLVIGIVFLVLYALKIIELKMNFQIAYVSYFLICFVLIGNYIYIKYKDGKNNG